MTDCVLTIQGGNAYKSGHGNFSFPQRVLPVPSKKMPTGNCTVLITERHKLSPPRKRPSRIRKKIAKRNGHLHYGNVFVCPLRFIKGKAQDLPHAFLREWIVLGEIRSDFDVKVLVWDNHEWLLRCKSDLQPGDVWKPASHEPNLPYGKVLVQP